MMTTGLRSYFHKKSHNPSTLKHQIRQQMIDNLSNLIILQLNKKLPKELLHSKSREAEFGAKKVKKQREDT